MKVKSVKFQFLQLTVGVLTKKRENVKCLIILDVAGMPIILILSPVKANAKFSV